MRFRLHRSHLTGH